MVILGLGSNVGDRLEYLRKACKAIAALKNFQIEQISPIYISDALLPENAPADWDMPYLNLSIRGKTQMHPMELLKELKNIEWSIGRKPEVRHWGPRILDIDILAMGNQIIESDALTVPHANLQNRPFALWPLADVAPFWEFPLAGPNHGKTAAQIVEQWGSRFSGVAPFHTRQINQRISTPSLVGILNITPDSFSDGGKFQNADAAFAHAEKLVLEGAEILDIGAESTSPKAKPISQSEEWERLEPVLTTILAKKNNFLLPPKISVDTRHPETAKRALTLGVDWINDVTGLDNIEMREIVIAGKADCLIMHHHSIPEDRNDVLSRNVDPNQAVMKWAEDRIKELESQGLEKSRIIFDPGIGFGKMAEQSLAVLQHIDCYQKLGVRILVGHSRKTFLSLVTNSPYEQRDVESFAITMFLAKKSVDYIRLHNIEMSARGLKVMQVLE